MDIKQSIVIFGGNSVLAQNFLKNYSNQTDITKITRLKKSENDISCDMGKFLYQKELSTLISQIRSRLIYERTVFILFSWCGGPRTNNNVEKVLNINRNIVSNFIGVCKKINPSKIIFLSSAGTLYPDVNRSKNYNELDIVSPKTFYGKQKFMAENMISNYALENNLKFTILRIASAYGYDKRFSDQGVINKWLYSAIENKSLKLFNSIDSVVNFISFKQISDAIYLSLINSLDGIYNIGTEKSISLKEVIDQISKVTKKKLELDIICNDKRFFNIDISKFCKITGTKFKLKLEDDIEIIYRTILEDRNIDTKVF